MCRIVSLTEKYTMNSSVRSLSPTSMNDKGELYNQFQKYSLLLNNSKG